MAPGRGARCRAVWIAAGAAAALVAIVGCGGAQPAGTIAEGRWHAWLDSPGGPLPFGLELARDGDDWRAVLANGTERIEIPRVTVDDARPARLEIGIDRYDSTITASTGQAPGTIVGTWRRRGSGGSTTELPFHATLGDAPRFDPVADVSPPAQIAGRWRARFSDTDDDAVGVFEQTDDGTVTGSFLTTMGDYRYLAGRVDGARLRLSTFDGAHAFLFDARLTDDGTMAGDFWSRDTWHESWIARRDPRAALPDAFTLTEPRGGVDLSALVFPDLGGTPRALDDPAFAGRARILYAFGSWCPNCGDETRLMTELDRRYRDDGLSIVGLAFELTGDLARDTAQVRTYARLAGIEFPLLVAGTSDKDEAGRALPLVDRVRAFPTTIFLDRDGTVRAIYTGFSGPATGEEHTRLRVRFETLIEGLLGLRDPGTASADATGGA